MSFYDLPFIYRPIDEWPGEETAERIRSPFAAKFSATYQLLIKELKLIEATNVVVMLALRPRDIRQDGHLRADARPTHPGVMIAFDSMHGPLKYACDRFYDHEDNMRAIALGLEALRKVERYGITKRGEQYRGFSALPPGMTTGEPMSRAEAWAVLSDCAFGSRSAVDGEYDINDRNDVELLYRIAAKLHHPDTGSSADRDVFEAAVDARAVLVGS